MIRIYNGTLPGSIFTKNYKYIYKQLSFLIIINLPFKKVLRRISIPYYIRKSGLSDQQIQELKSHESHFRL